MGKTVIRIVVDSDGLVALLHPGDAHADIASQILKDLIGKSAHLLYPATTLIETATLFQRRLKEPEIADRIAQMIQSQTISITPIGQDMMEKALTYYQPLGGSTHNTLFDAVVAATAAIYKADAILSFDKWYTSLGFVLAGDFVKQA